MNSKEPQPLFFIRYEAIFEKSTDKDQIELFTLEEVTAKISELAKANIDTSKLVIIDSGNDLNSNVEGSAIVPRYALDLSKILNEQ